ncbi:MAG: hypothetical protein HY952_05400 [Elusimicrobia bacterium]|nr:hypothetical protein [Elusimicrobiota bacterium]
MSWCVLTAGEQPPLQPVLAAILGAAFKLDRDTAAKEARRGWGLLGRNLDDATTEKLEEAAAVYDVKLLKLPEQGLPALPAPRPAKKVIFSPGSALFTLEGAELPCAPDRVLVLAAAPVKEEFFREIKTSEGPSSKEKAVRMGIMAVTGLPIGLGKTKETVKQVKSFETSFYMDLLLDGGAERLRVASDDFDFSGLKEKKTYSSQLNFRLLCAELAAFAPAAAKNAGISAILAGRPLTPLPYDGLSDLETETLRLLLARGK